MCRPSRVAISMMAYALPLTVAAPAEARNQGMSQYLWKNRPLIVFTPSSNTTAYRRQKQILAGNASGLRGRDMVVISVVGNRLAMQLDRGRGLSAARLRQRYGVTHGTFRVLLVGKDGGVKLRSPKPLSTARLFRTIDAMPMRQREMRSRAR